MNIYYDILFNNKMKIINIYKKVIIIVSIIWCVVKFILQILKRNSFEIFKNQFFKCIYIFVRRKNKKFVPIFLKLRSYYTQTEGIYEKNFIKWFLNEKKILLKLFFFFCSRYIECASTMS